MASIDVAKLLNKITQDIPGINTVLKALAKWDVSALTDVPDGAMQATTDTNNNLTIKKKVSGSYTPVAKLMHDVDKLDGYHASTSATANSIPVRNAQGALPGNILGNAVTADTATALATGTVVPVNQGGTGATTASQARANLGVSAGTDFTAHVATQASPSVEGHVKLDALAAGGSNTAAPGGFGWGTITPVASDLNTLGGTCLVWCNPGTTANRPPAANYHACVFHMRVNAGTALQYHYANGGLNILSRRQNSSVWSDWTLLPKGLTDSTSTVASDIAASATAVKAVNDAVAVAQATADNAGKTPATTTARGIGRVATSADLVDGATISNGPAFLAAGSAAVTTTPTPNAVPRAGADGRLTPGFIPGLFVGDIRLLPFRATDLATYCRGWHFCNGDQYALTSPVGSKLNSLPTDFKADWGITVSGGNISIPKLFYSDGRGYFLRAVDGTGRIVGSVQQDAFQGHWHMGSAGGSTPGAVTWVDPIGAGPLIGRVGVFDAVTDNINGTPRTAIETRGLNVGMTPAIFLDV